ncbi:MAG: hypothetical protein Q4D79_09260 [Propionibacteriaceae bacterium]|nr:hypothetical protein [Propionibacteriaceae bacterium]
MSVLSSAAEVIGIDAASSAFGLGVDKAAGAPLGLAAVAEEDAGFEVVVVDAVAGVVGAQGSDVLGAVEEFLGDQGFVASLELFSFEGDDAGVVGVGEHAVQCSDGDGAWVGVAAGRSGFQAEVGHGDLELLDGVVAGGVEFEGFADERAAFGVDSDGVDAASLDVFGDVQVAQWGYAAGAALFDFAA